MALRRDLEALYGPEAELSKVVKTPILTSLGIMMGMELLSKMWSGDHMASIKQIGAFLQEVSNLDEKVAAALVQFRCALAHGYRLGTKRHKDGKEFSFAVSDAADQPQLIYERDNTHFVNVLRLRDLFLDTIKAYRTLVESDSDSDLQQKFVVCLANLGEVAIREEVV